MDVRIGLKVKLSIKELMVLNCGVGEDSWESLEQQGDWTSPPERKSVLNIHWKDWYWSWNSKHFGHLMWRTDALEKTLMLGKIEGRQRRGWQRTRWLDGNTDAMDMGLSKRRKLVMDWLDLLAVQGTLKSLFQHHSSEASIFRCSAFFIVQLSHPYMTAGKIIALIRWTFVGKVMSLFVFIFMGKNSELIFSLLYTLFPGCHVSLCLCLFLFKFFYLLQCIIFHNFLRECAWKFFQNLACLKIYLF